jgi:hypothetical protein
MTLALAIASRIDNVGRIWLVSDTRIENTTKEKSGSYTFDYDSYTKTRWIWGSCALISSGASLPVTLAVETSRPAIFGENTSVSRATTQAEQ